MGIFKTDYNHIELSKQISALIRYTCACKQTQMPAYQNEFEI